MLVEIISTEYEEACTTELVRQREAYHLPCQVLSGWVAQLRRAWIPANARARLSSEGFTD